MDVHPQVPAAGRHGPGIGRRTGRVLPVVSIRHLLESTDVLHLGADDGKPGAGSAHDDRSVGQDSQALAVVGGQLADGHDLSAVEADDDPAVQERVPFPGARCQGGDGVPVDKGVARVQVEKALFRPYEQHRNPTYRSSASFGPVCSAAPASRDCFRF